ncbi:MAG: RagB/SusD family nutrient uptake outer membrane protein [Catalinimonas sp.]
MQKTIKNISLCAALLATQACGVLDVEPQQSLTRDQLFTSGDGARVALVGLYSEVQEDDYYGLHVPLMSDQYVDIGIYNGFFLDWQQLDNGVIPALNVAATDTWVQIYTVIENANVIIARVPTIDDASFDEDDRAEVIAEAKAIRALAYFDLLRHWGAHFDLSSPYGVPVLLESLGGDLANLKFLPRNTVEGTYQAIIQDLQDAEAVLAPTDDATRVSLGFVQGMLARVHLYRGEYAQAADKATEVIESGDYALEDEYADVFDIDQTNESIFELSFNNNDQSGFSNFLGRRAEMLVDPSLVEYFYPGDTLGPDARGVLISNASRARFLKYDDRTNSTDPAYIMRLAEMYLIRAEALALRGEPADGLGDLNVIRERAGLEPITVGEGETLTQEAFDTALLNEYKYEFYAEGLRFFALVRRGRLADVGITEEFRRVFPIPLQEIQIPGNLIEQYPGYEGQ